MAGIDKGELDKFSSLADKWWTGEEFETLHKINPVRVEYILSYLPENRQNLKLLDIGCGGGILCESLSRLGINVTGIDPSENSISVAREHAKKNRLNIAYHASSVSDFAGQGAKTNYDAITLMEVVEHTDALDELLTETCKLLKVNGVIFISTLNRTFKSLLLGIVAAEYILGWVPRGTHTWKKFVKPSEIYEVLLKNSVILQGINGIVYKALENTWELSAHDVGVNYILAAKKIR